MDVSKIMSENFEMILKRGGNLNKLSQLSSSLKEDSKKVSYAIDRIIIKIHSISVFKSIKGLIVKCFFVCLFVQLKKDAHKLKMSFWIRKYATFIAVGGLILFFFFLRFYVF